MMDKQYAIAVMTIILGFGVNQAGNSDAFLNGLGIGIIAMGLVWVAIRLIKELKKNEVKIS
jgi:Na+-transporting methylmalonyl-CoA/oxaloacetate decarboxylase beta subunit